MTARPTRAAEDTRRRILRAAFEEFHRNGFQGGSLNHIVEEAGTTKGGLFHHFAGKQELGYAVVEEIIRPRIREVWFEPLEASIDPVTDLKRAVRRFAREEAENGRIVRGCPLNNLAQEMSPVDEGFRTRLEAVYTDWRVAVEAALSRGIKARKVRKDVSPREVAAFVVAALAGIIGTAKNAESEELMTRAGSALFDYLEGLRP